MATATYPSLPLDGQLVLVTGASAGIGAACAWRFAAAGCNLVLVARRTEKLQELRDQLTSQFKVKVHLVTADLSDTKAVDDVPLNLPKEFQEVDILVNNAGLALGTSAVHENDLKDAVAMVTTNCMSVVQLTKHFTAGMVMRNRGHVVNISSIAAHYAYPGGSVYCGSKHFVDAFTNVARHDLVGTNIRVTAISPGAVKTEFSQVRYKGDSAKADAVYEGIVPLNADDIADNVMYAVTRPAHVQIGEIVVYATYQSSPQSIARVLKAKS